MLPFVAMQVPRPRLAALLVSVLFLAAELFAFAPLLHPQPCCAAGTVAADSALAVPARPSDTAGVAAAGVRGPSRGMAPAPPAQGECPACRIASLAMVAQEWAPLAMPLPRPVQASVAPSGRSCWRTLDRACGRAPPRA